MAIDELLDPITGSFASWVMWAYGLLALAVLVGWVPRLAMRVRRAEVTRGERVGALVLVVATVAAAALLSVPFSEGPYRCSPVAAGAEGRQTVYPDDAPRSTGDLPLLQRRQQVCDDAAKARGVSSAVMFGGGLLIGWSVSFLWRRDAVSRQVDLPSSAHQHMHAPSGRAGP
jgi:hypothetical protein